MVVVFPPFRSFDFDIGLVFQAFYVPMMPQHYTCTVNKCGCSHQTRSNEVRFSPGSLQLGMPRLSGLAHSSGVPFIGPSHTFLEIGALIV